MNHILRLLLALLLLPTAVWAHALLISASPRVGSTVAVAPAELVLRFTETPELRFSEILVQDAAGTRVDRNDLHPGADDAKSLVVGLSNLKAGVYTVRWQVLSVDTHRTEGNFRFTVAP